MKAEALQNLKKIYLAALAAYASMLGAVILYGVLALWALNRFGTPQFHFPLLLLQIVAGICAAFQFWFSFRVRNFTREKIPAADFSGPAPVEIYTSALLRSSVLGFAVCETIAVDGLALAFLTGKVVWFWFFAAFAAACFALHLPKQNEWETWLGKKLNLGG